MDNDKLTKAATLALYALTEGAACRVLTEREHEALGALKTALESETKGWCSECRAGTPVGWNKAHCPSCGRQWDAPPSPPHHESRKERHMHHYIMHHYTADMGAVWKDGCIMLPSETAAALNNMTGLIVRAVDRLEIMGGVRPFVSSSKRLIDMNDAELKEACRAEKS